MRILNWMINAYLNATTFIQLQNSNSLILPLHLQCFHPYISCEYCRHDNRSANDSRLSAEPQHPFKPKMKRNSNRKEFERTSCIPKEKCFWLSSTMLCVA